LIYLFSCFFLLRFVIFFFAAIALGEDVVWPDQYVRAKPRS